MDAGQDGKYFKLCDETSVKSTTSELPAGHLLPINMENGIHKEVNKTENDVVLSEAPKLFIKRKPSTTAPNEDEHLPLSPTSTSLRRDSAWSSEPVLSLKVPQVAFQNQLRNQYDAFGDSDGVLLSKILAGQLGHPELTTDERNTVRSRKFKLWKALRYFITSTSFHGLPHIAASRSYVRICYWLFLFLLSLGIMLWAIIVISQTYFTFNTYIKTELEELSQLKFPAVTICNLNQYTKSSIQRYYTEEEIFDAALFIDALSNRRVLTRDYNINELHYLIAELAEMYSDDFAQNITVDPLIFSHKLENMFVSCYFNNQPCYKDYFSSNVNFNGGCFTFNSNISDVLYVTSSGDSYGLEMVLNVEQYEYFLAQSNSIGFKVYVHQQGDFPYFGEHDGFTVSPGVHTDIVLSTEQLEYLEPPYGVCRKDLKLDYFAIYTREACKDECRTKITAKVCGFKMAYMPGNAATCSASDYADCVVPLLKDFWKNYQCDCPLPCSVPESYHYSLSYSAYPGKHFPSLLQQAGVLANMPGIPDFIRELNTTDNTTQNEIIFNFFKENIAKIRLFYNQLSLNKLTEVVEYSAFQFIADFGGHLGLFTGAGFLTLFEFVEVCLGIFHPTESDHH